MNMHMAHDDFAVDRFPSPKRTTPGQRPGAWLNERLRGTNWTAAAVAAALQGGFLAVLIGMGVVDTSEPPREKRVVTVLSTAPVKPAPAAPVPAEQPSKTIEPPKADIVAPTPKLNVSAAPPVAAAPERVPEPVKAAPAPAAPSAPPAPSAPAAPTGPVTVSNLATNLVSGTPPAYPAESRRKREEGTVVLWVQISRDGRVTQVSVQRTSGFAKLDEAALAAVRKWRWSATMRDGRAVEVEGAVRIPFVLRKA